MRYIFLIYTFLFIITIFTVYGCDNARHRINVNTNPFSTKFEEKTKVGYSITFGKERKETIKEE
jgi:hypothetical protein